MRSMAEDGPDGGSQMTEVSNRISAGGSSARTRRAAEAVLGGQRRGPLRAAAFPRAGRHRLRRLYGSRQFRHEHPGRCELRLSPALGRALRQPRRHALPGALGEARHRHGPQSRGALPQALLKTRGHLLLDRERDRRHGNRSRRVPGRDHRLQSPLRPAALDRRHRHRRHHLFDPAARAPRVSGRSSWSSARSSA